MTHTVSSSTWRQLISTFCSFGHALRLETTEERWNVKWLVNQDFTFRLRSLCIMTACMTNQTLHESACWVATHIEPKEGVSSVSWRETDWEATGMVATSSSLSLCLKILLPFQLLPSQLTKHSLEIILKPTRQQLWYQSSANSRHAILCANKHSTPWLHIENVSMNVT